MADVRPLLRSELLPPKPPARRHMISIADLEREDVERLLALARTFARSLERDVKKLPTLRGRTVVNLFFEASTRTSSSFELAAKRLSADVMSIKSSGSAVEKGESLKDTLLTIGAYDPDVIVIRHAHIGAPHLAARYTPAHVVNAGDGKHQHPTQALLDLYTLDEELGGIEGLHVAIVGDVLHSRVARSNIQALVLMGARVTLIGPPPLIPRGIEAMGCEVSYDIADVKTADVVYVLRMQRERMLEGANYVPSLREYTARWGVTPERLRPGQKVMHPGPMNRGVEIDAAVADAAESLVERQVRSGLVVRMAVLYDLLTQGPVEVKVAEIEEVAVMLFAQERQEGLADLRGRPRRRPDPGHRRDAHGHGRARPDHRASSRPRAATGRCSRRRSSTRTSTCARPGREDEEDLGSGTARGRGGRLLRHPRHAEHGAGRRLGRRPRRPHRARAARRRRCPSASSPPSRRRRKGPS